MEYRIEYYDNQKNSDIVILLGSNLTPSMKAKARKLSGGPWRTDLNTVYVIGSDNDGDQEQYTYYAGSLIEKDFVRDWH